MTAPRWQYRLRYTNLPVGEGGPDAEWRDVGTLKIQNVMNHSVLEFRPRPARRSLLPAVLRRPESKRRAS